MFSQRLASAGNGCAPGHFRTGIRGARRNVVITYFLPDPISNLMTNPNDFDCTLRYTRLVLSGQIGLKSRHNKMVFKGIFYTIS